MIREVRYYSQMLAGVYSQTRVRGVSDPASAIREQMRLREERFLDLAQQRVFQNPRNPYHQLFRLAGCGYEDLADGVRTRGLSETLAALASEGVYLSNDEFKGQTPLIRAGREIPSSPGDYAVSVKSPGTVSLSGGSRSAGNRHRESAHFQVYKEGYHAIENAEFDLQRRVRIQLRPILPSSMGITHAIRAGRLGQPVEHWFAVAGKMADSGHYRAVTRVIVQAGRWMGAPIPFPTYLPDNDFSPVARWIAERKREGKPCALWSFVSPAVRVAAAARDLNLDISGTIFLVGGESLTEPKRAAIEASGSQVYPRYYINEIGPIGFSCRSMRHGDGVHLFHDSVSVGSRIRIAPLSGQPVNSLLFTNLLPLVSRFLINVEMDDTGIIEPASCSCAFSAAGFHTQIRDISSYGKMTGQGITLFGTDVLRILEIALPERFGGVPGDYQLVESEGERQTDVVLRVSPRLGLRSTVDVREFFLDELRRCFGGSLAARLWKHSEGIEVLVEEPSFTRTGKVLPLHLLGSAAIQTAAPAEYAS